mmetsp:Transcript_43697/g.139236  ORF Transcript_43697/g.139236 Transcript_43697/m.139236 type:complete len:306 (-) Transcript_43697:65-982(-)
MSQAFMTVIALLAEVAALVGKEFAALAAAAAVFAAFRGRLLRPLAGEAEGPGKARATGPGHATERESRRGARVAGCCGAWNAAARAAQRVPWGLWGLWRAAASRLRSTVIGQSVHQQPAAMAGPTGPQVLRGRVADEAVHRPQRRRQERRPEARVRFDDEGDPMGANRHPHPGPLQLQTAANAVVHSVQHAQPAGVLQQPPGAALHATAASSHAWPRAVVVEVLPPRRGSSAQQRAFVAANVALLAASLWAVARAVAGDKPERQPEASPEPCRAPPIRCHACAGATVFLAGALLNCKSFFAMPAV